jgi:GDP-D-mannose dehydratase
VGIRDGTKDEIEWKETDLSSAQVTEILTAVRNQEVFNLSARSETMYEDMPDPKVMDATTWCFERLRVLDGNQRSKKQDYTIVSRWQSEHGPAKEVFSIFSKYALKLFPEAPKLLEPQENP